MQMGNLDVLKSGKRMRTLNNLFEKNLIIQKSYPYYSPIKYKKTQLYEEKRKSTNVSNGYPDFKRTV